MTANDIYSRALVLLGEKDGDGMTQPDTSVFEKNAPELINVLLEMTHDTDMLMKGLPAKDGGTVRITSPEDDIPVHPRLASAVLPLGLCYLLVYEENNEKGAMFYRLFREEKERLEKTFRRSKRTVTKDVYKGR